jgi:subtilisin family serine protease
VPRRALPLAALLVSVSLAATAAPVHATAPERPAAAGEEAVETAVVGDMVVQFEPDVDDAERLAVLAERGLELVDEVGGSDFVVARPNGRRSAAEVTDADEVVGVEPVVTMRASATPNDPAYRDQWHLPMIQAPRAWDVSPTAGAGVVVAVIDTGVAYRTAAPHVRAPDLAGVRFVHPKDYVDGDDFPDDLNGHGTHVTGSIAQTTNNGIGGAGLAHGASIMPVRVLDADGEGTIDNIARGIRHAVDNGAHIINLSLGGPTPSAVVADAVKHAHARDVTVIAASGNENVSKVSFPAAFPEAISVGAVRFDKRRAPYSNYGSLLDLVAPGGDMGVNQNGDRYPDGILQQTLETDSALRGIPGRFCFCFRQGTSMATPQVSAAAALLVARGTTKPAAIRKALLDSAQDLGPAGRDDHFGHGLLQARAALENFVPGKTGRPIDRPCPVGTVPPGPFTDVDDNPHRRSIECVAWRGIASGVATDTYRPGGTVSRAQMARFLVGVVESTGYVFPSSLPDAFDDDNGSTHEVPIDKLASVGIYTGTGNRKVGPDANVTREALAAFLVRTHDFLASSKLTVDADYFTDDNASVHQLTINKAAAAGLTSGTAPRTYSPTRTLTRAQMATFLARLLDALTDR